MAGFQLAFETGVDPMFDKLVLLVSSPMREPCLTIHSNHRAHCCRTVKMGDLGVYVCQWLALSVGFDFDFSPPT